MNLSLGGWSCAISDCIISGSVNGSELVASFNDVDDMFNSFSVFFFFTALLD